MQVLKSGFIHKAGILLFSLIIVVIGTSAIDKNFHVFTKLSSLPGEVAGVIIVPDTDKFINGVGGVNIAGAQASAPYQNVSGDVAISGNVGIGTTNPSGILHLYGSAPYEYIDNTSVAANSAGGVVFSNSGSVKGRVVLVGGAGGGIIGLSAGDLAIRTASTKIAFSTDDGTTAHMVINAGNVGIGTANPNQKLDVNGIVQSQVGGTQAGTFFVNGAYANYIDINIKGALWGISMWASSGKLKKDITDIEIDTSKIYDLRPVSYNWKDPKRGTGRQFGLIAEEVAQVIPELAMYGENNKVTNVNYPFLSVLLLKEMQKQQLAKDGKYEQFSQTLDNQAREIYLLKVEIEKLKNK